MPSHGSHSSGGSFSHSSGGSSSGGGSWGGHYHGPRRTFIFWGPRIYGRTNGFVGFLTGLMFFAIFFSLIFGLALAGQNSNFQTIENDYKYYYTDLCKIDVQTATVDSIKAYEIYENQTYYYITFHVKTNAPGEDVTLLNGDWVKYYETTATYTFDEATEIKNRGTILIGTDGTDAVQADYNFDTDIEWKYKVQSFNEQQKALTICLVVGCVLIAICVGSIIFLNLKDLKKENTDRPKQYDTNRSENRYTKRCAYCGAELDPSQKKCPNCGAKITTTKSDM